MRLSRTAWLILGIGVLVIALVALYVVYSRQSSEQRELKASLATAQASLPGVVSGREAAEAELTQWQDKLAEDTSLLARSQAKFPKSEESIEYDEVLFDIAYACHLDVTKITASEPNITKVGDITFTVFSFDVEVRSVRNKVDDILDMATIIDTGEDFTAANVEVVKIEIREPTAAGETELPTATISLVGYSYGGE
jgi:hypothetical protein